MLPKQYRLNKKEDFQKVLKHGKMTHGAFLSMASLQGVDTSLFGIIVSNKVSKSAVERNRIRRSIRSALQEFARNNDKQAMYVFLAKKTSVEADAQQITKEVQYLLNKNA